MPEIPAEGFQARDAAGAELRDWQQPAEPEVLFCMSVWVCYYSGPLKMGVGGSAAAGESMHGLGLQTSSPKFILENLVDSSFFSLPLFSLSSFSMARYVC
jgi:hypothetical protein